MKEKEIEDKLEKELDKIEPGLTLIERQKRVDSGVIDLFCRDKKGNSVIIEVKTNPSERVIAQLAKYNMALIKKGFSKKKLRTILVAPKSSRSVKEACSFFNFEIKNVYKEEIKNKTKEKSKKIEFPNEEELIIFIKKKELVNFSAIAKYFEIKNATVSDLIAPLEKNGLVEVKKLGGSKIVRVHAKK